MKLRKLDQTFYDENIYLIQALDNESGKWIPGKTRGHGIVVININKLTFAIPLRTSIKHNAAYITQKSNQKGIKGKGLDYSKALLITHLRYISDEIFLIPPEQHKNIQGKEFFITRKFEKYVEKYIKAVKKGDKHILNSLEYRFTTLQNYHDQLKV
ncbi:type III toxin-antitoxin system TenpIN family toxin [Xenorhabdus innexi]|uniref:Uncharacterized protein n=1 Tax=Xenorhabdus innexi TaxID=290109 RepID=A0A1N6MUB5_9GAMM|nr:hypothetical protein [Xenorhabdus innexi]PHM28552.1 hypothetical protein Xinn_03814 [Xenorhabdus innexi]SIP72446.1 conserved hypothetical protein [Xenorhabdus innexi]